jgi:YD repeat-containing protein
MKKCSGMTICALAFSALALAGCATKPRSPENAAAQRTVVTKVPVLVKEASFYPDGLADAYIVYKLDDAKKNWVEKDSYDASRPDPIGRLVVERKDGRPSAELLYDSDGRLFSRREFGYDAAGRLASERLIDAKGATLSSSAYSYDSSGRKVEWRALDGSGAAMALTSYAYGKDGLAGVEMRNSGGAATGSIKLEYAGGKLAKRSYFGADKALLKYEAYAYAGARLSALETRGADGSLAAKTAYEYGSLGELVKATEYLPSGSISAYTTYEYIVREDSSAEISSK